MSRHGWVEEGRRGRGGGGGRLEDRRQPLVAAICRIHSRDAEDIKAPSDRMARTSRAHGGSAMIVVMTKAGRHFLALRSPENYRTISEVEEGGGGVSGLGEGGGQTGIGKEIEAGVADEVPMSWF